MVTVDRAAGTGTMGWFSQFGSTHSEPFEVPPGSSGNLGLVDDQGVLAVQIGGRRVATVVDPVLEAPTLIGVAARGDSASCEYDDITLTTAP